MWCICRVKRIVHLKIEIWCLSAYPKDIQDVGYCVSTIEHKLRFLTQSVTVCHSWQSMGALRETKTCTDKTKLNPAARDDTLKSKDKERLVCARSWTVFIYIFFYLWSAALISSRAAGFNLVLSVYVFFSLKAVGPIDCNYMTDWMQRFELKIFVCVLLEKQSHLHLECI